MRRPKHGIPYFFCFVTLILYPPPCEFVMYLSSHSDAPTTTPTPTTATISTFITTSSSSSLHPEASQGTVSPSCCSLADDAARTPFARRGMLLLVLFKLSSPKCRHRKNLFKRATLHLVVKYKQLNSARIN